MERLRNFWNYVKNPTIVAALIALSIPTYKEFFTKLEREPQEQLFLNESCASPQCLNRRLKRLESDRDELESHLTIVEAKRDSIKNVGGNYLDIAKYCRELESDLKDIMLDIIETRNKISIIYTSKENLQKETKLTVDSTSTILSSKY